MTDRDIEDTREQETQEWDVDAMLDRIYDAVDKESADFLQEYLDDYDRRIHDLYRTRHTLYQENAALQQSEEKWKSLFENLLKRNSTGDLESKETK